MLLYYIYMCRRELYILLYYIYMCKGGIYMLLYYIYMCMDGSGKAIFLPLLRNCQITNFLNNFYLQPLSTNYER